MHLGWCVGSVEFVKSNMDVLIEVIDSVFDKVCCGIGVLKSMQSVLGLWREISLIDSHWQIYFHKLGNKKWFSNSLAAITLHK